MNDFLTQIKSRSISAQFDNFVQKKVVYLFTVGNLRKVDFCSPPRNIRECYISMYIKCYNKLAEIV